MAKVNYNRNGCKDVFNAFLVKNATYSKELYEMPELKAENSIPDKLIAFSKCISSKEYDSWVHFFEDDYQFERIWNQPKKYLPILKKFKGVIAPDFSVYRDMPFPMQIWQIYRSRAISAWLQENGIRVIPNIRYADDRSFLFCCNGISKKSIIAIGTHGTIKNRDDRKYFIDGLKNVVDILQPTHIVVYGAAPYSIFNEYREMGIEIVNFDSDFSKSRREIH